MLCFVTGRQTLECLNVGPTLSNGLHVIRLHRDSSKTSTASAGEPAADANSWHLPNNTEDMAAYIIVHGNVCVILTLANPSASVITPNYKAIGATDHFTM